MTSSQDFITKFHNLHGTLLGEKKKSLQSLLNSSTSLNPDIVDEIIRNLSATTYLEETFKIEVLLFYRRFDNLLSSLINGEEIQASKIIRQEWFVKELVERFTPTQHVNLMSTLSLSIRTKLLKKILIYVKSEHNIEHLFDEIGNVYGFKVASVLITGCSSGKIKEVIEKTTLNLSASQLKLLFNKDKSVILKYFGELDTNGKSVDSYKFNSFFDYVSVEDPTFYFEIADKFKLHKRKLGRKSTKKFIGLKKDEILDNPEKYSGCLRKDALVRKLGTEFPKFYKKALPKRLSHFRHCFAKSLIRYYPKNKQYELYFNSFQEIYNKSLWDNTEYMDERLIELINDEKERDLWISKYEDRKNIEKYKVNKRLLKRKKCAMYFVEDVKPFTVKERKTIFNTLISTCKLTKDYDAFLNILKTFCERHRNSDVTILYNFLRIVHKELDVKKLTEEHWKYIHEILSIQLFKKQHIYFPIYLEYIKFLYLRGESIEQSVRSLMNELPKRISAFSSFVYNNDDFQKCMLEMYIKLLPEIKDEHDSLGIEIALSVIKWNTKHPTNAIPISNQQFVLNYAMKMKDTVEINANFMKVFKYLICRQDRTQPSELDEIYWSNFKNLNNATITRWYLKYKPSTLSQNLDQIGIILKNKDINLVRSLKKFDHIDIPKNVKTLCLEELKTAEPSKRERVIKIMVYFMTSKELLDYLKEYIPETSRVEIDNNNEIIQKTYEIQCGLGKYIKLSTGMSRFLPDLLKYCRGDKLSSALTSLYSSFCRIPENQLYSALEELSTKSVSVRKHTIFLSSLILPKEKVLLKYKQIQTTEKNYSVKQHMLLSCFKYFNKNYEPTCWLIIEEYIKKMQRKEKSVLTLLTKVDCIPNSYRPIFTEIAWETLCKFKDGKDKLDSNMNSLLRNLTKTDVSNLRFEFSCTIQEYLFNTDECSIEGSVFEFVKKFVLYNGNPEKKIDALFLVVHSFKEKFWNDQPKKVQVLKTLNKFCFEFLGMILEEGVENFEKTISKLFYEAWMKDFLVEETFEEHLLMNFMLFNAENGFNLNSLPKRMNEVFSSALEKYGNLIISSFKNFLSASLQLVFKNTDTDYNLELLKFLDAFLRENCTPNHCALVIELLPNDYLQEEAEIEFKKLTEMLMQKDQVVRIKLFEKLKSGYYY